MNDKDLSQRITSDLLELPAQLGALEADLAELRADLRDAKRALEEAEQAAIINAVIDETAGTESGRITSLNPSAKKK